MKPTMRRALEEVKERLASRSPSQEQMPMSPGEDSPCAKEDPCRESALDLLTDEINALRLKADGLAALHRLLSGYDGEDKKFLARNAEEAVYQLLIDRLHGPRDPL